MVWRLGGRQFSGATQLLPLGVSSEQASAALESLTAALKGSLPESGHHELKLARDVWSWKDYRVSTKNLLSALANSLKQYMPESWNLSLCKPQNLLAPRCASGERVQYLPDEVKLRPGSCGLDFYFIHDMKTGVRRPDFFLGGDHYRLIYSSDEGTEVTGFKTNTSVELFSDYKDFA